MAMNRIARALIVLVIGVSVGCGSSTDESSSAEGSSQPEPDENSGNPGSDGDAGAGSDDDNDGDASDGGDDNGGDNNMGDDGDDNDEEEPVAEACETVGEGRLGECDRDNDNPAQSRDIVVTDAPQLCTPDMSGMNVWTPVQACEWECNSGFVQVENECLDEATVEDPCDGVDDTLDINDNGIADCTENLLLNGQFASDLANWGGLIEDGNTREWNSADAQGNPNSGSAFLSDATGDPANDDFSTNLSQCIDISGAGSVLTLYAQLQWLDDGGEENESVRLDMRASAHVGSGCSNVLVNRPFNRQDSDNFLFRTPRETWGLYGMRLAIPLDTGSMQFSVRVFNDFVGDPDVLVDNMLLVPGLCNSEVASCVVAEDPFQ